MRDRSTALKELHRRRADRLADEVLQGGSVSEEALAQVEALERLAHLTRPPARRRWGMAAAFLLAAAIGAALLTIRFDTTEVDLQLQLTGVRFELASDPAGEQLLVGEDAELTRLVASGLSRVRIPRSAEHAGISHSGEGLALRLSVDDTAGNPAGEITLSPFSVPSESLVDFEPEGTLEDVRLRIEGDDLSIKASVQGPVLTQATSVPAARRTFTRPRPVSAHSADGPLALELTAPDGVMLATPLKVKGLRLTRVERFSGASGSVVRTASSVASGSLFQLSLDGRERKLRRGELLSFASAVGSIRALEVREGMLHLDFQGAVRGMSVGSGNTAQSLMPTLFDWLLTRHTLWVLWGAILYGYAMLESVREWWRAE